MLKKNVKKTFVIAEIGINHNGDIREAKKLIASAKKAGADAVKFQTYITEKRTKKDSPIFDILKKCELGFESFKILKEYSEKLDIFFFSTAFDRESVDYLLKDLKIPLIKIASFDSSNIDLIKQINKYKTDIIISLGMTKKKEIDPIIKKLSKNRDLALLHCVTSYPIKEEESNLSAIHTLKKDYDNIIGYSDHTKGIKVPILAVAAGAQIIEKHFMINKNDNCIDKAVSLDQKNFQEMIKGIRHTEKTLGNNKINIRDVEKKFLYLKRKKLS